MWSGGSSESTVATTAMTDVERGTGMARHKAAVPGAAAMYDQAAAVDASRDSLTDPASSDLDGDAASDPTEGVASRSISRTGTQDATLRMEAGRRRGAALGVVGQLLGAGQHEHRGRCGHIDPCHPHRQPRAGAAARAAAV